MGWVEISISRMEKLEVIEPRYRSSNLNYWVVYLKNGNSNSHIYETFNIWPYWMLIKPKCVWEVADFSILTFFSYLVYNFHLKHILAFNMRSNIEIFKDMAIWNWEGILHWLWIAISEVNKLTCKTNCGLFNIWLARCHLYNLAANDTHQKLISQIASCMCIFLSHTNIENLEVKNAPISNYV